MNHDFWDALADKIDVMNECPPYKSEGLESLSRLGYLKAVNEMAQWLVERRIGET